jgi:NarL family two-component system sensor histidine kinase YdfH
VQLTVKDDGNGFDPAQAAKKSGHFGLTGIRERAEALGGTVIITGWEGQGSEIVATIGTTGSDRTQ